LRNVQAELERTGRFFKSLYETLINGDITNIEYKEMKQSYETKIAALTEQEKNLRKSARLAELETVKRNKAINKIGTIFDETQFSKELIDTLIEKILIFEDKHIEIHFKFTDEIVKMGGTANE